MSKQVIVIASGLTEYHALPHLVQHLQEDDIHVTEIRIPKLNKQLDVAMAEKLIKAAWWAPPASGKPHKFVVLVDADTLAPDEVLRPFREQLKTRLGANITADVQFACAVQHLEAWYFADAANLKAWLGRDPGNVDVSQPDSIQNPKLHLKHLLGDLAYTAEVSKEIAQNLHPPTIADRSPSFCGLLHAIRDGDAAAEARKEP